jgi:LysR family transcriptional activator of nhaA
VSEQVHALQDALGERLLRREGRGIALTETGHTVFRFAEEIFSLGSELVDTVRGRPTGRPLRLAVGIADVVPKLVAFRILEPALAMVTPARLVCREDAQERLLPDLVAHELDMVIADAPAGPGLGPTYSHLLGECGVSVFASARLATKLRTGFPRSLHGAPFLLPTGDTALRRELDAWFDAREIVPEVVGEMQDAALLSTFAEAGLGLFAAPDAIASETGLARGLRRVGTLTPLRARYYAITVERRLAHPAVATIAGVAREKLFGRSKATVRQARK